MSDWIQHIVFDVEADGPCPGLYNMISFGLVSVADPSHSFLGEVAPAIDSPGILRARAVGGISFEAQKTFEQPEVVMAAAQTWLDETAEGKRSVFWSDNPAFDWQFWNWYCHKFVGGNPAGFSARRIGDLDAGRRNDPFHASSWKKQRITKHTHNPSMMPVEMRKGWPGCSNKWVGKLASARCGSASLSAPLLRNENTPKASLSERKARPNRHFYLP